ncbi:MAG: DUF72 domain-containing protein [candidate division NC10 bacterium]|nr:DUF72 domain-containing protein [candidate division NC10 bacterium]
MSVKVGCCGFPMAKAEYYRQFPVVEIQQTFYNLPRAQTAEKWRRGALALHSRSGRGDFEFTLKAWQLITHEPSSPTYRRLRKPIPDAERNLVGSFRATEPVLKAWTETVAVARALGASLIVFQCPPRFTPTADHVENLRKFFESADRTEFVMAWEPRGDWPPDLVRGLCAELQLVHVADPLKQVSQSEGLRYFRLHGVTGYRYLHTDQDLQIVAERCATDAPTYVLFNNLFMGEDALRFQRLLGRPALQAVRSARQRRA